jgi:hypothetical protein
VSALLAIASNTFRESVRNRVLHALVGATVALSALSYVLAWVSGDEPSRRARVIADVSLSAIALLGALCAIFLGTNLVYQEIERRTVYTILARPVSRGEFILGKFVGLSAVVCASVAAMGVGFLAFAVLYAKLDGREIDVGLGHVVAIGFTAVELVLVVAVAILFSSIAHPIEGAVFAFVVALAGHFTESLDRLGREIVTERGGSTITGYHHVASWILHAIYVLFPDLEKLNFRAEAVHGLPIGADRAGLALAYAALYTALLLTFAVLGFRRRTL